MKYFQNGGNSGNTGNRRHLYFFKWILFCCYLIFIAMLFLNKNSNKTIAYKKEYFIQKIKITPKRLQLGIHNVNKSGLKI
jgi:hypothetical protein